MELEIRFCFVAAVVVATTGAAPASSDNVSYNVEAGPCEVVVVESLRLEDAERCKTLDLRVQYPKAPSTGATPREKGESPSPQRFPLIVFSHGAGGSKEGVVPLTRHWASHGYITVQPTHDDSVRLRRERGEAYTLLDAVQVALGDPDAWVDRARDVRFLLDSLGTMEERVPALRGRIDRERIGMSGHSFGAATTVYLAGAKVTLPGAPNPQELGDDRIDAFIALSPQGPGRMGLTNGSWAEIRRPLMFMTGSKDGGGRAEYTPQWRLTAYDGCPPGDKFAVWIDGASHMTFACDAARAATGRSVLPLNPAKDKLEEEARYIRSIRMASTAFWDAYLKGDREAKRLLESDALKRSSDSCADLRRK